MIDHKMLKAKIEDAIRQYEKAIAEFDAFIEEQAKIPTVITTRQKRKMKKRKRKTGTSPACAFDRYEGNEKAVKSAAEANEIFLDSSPPNT